jgi:uncharacterized protein (TIGR02001 family)
MAPSLGVTQAMRFDAPLLASGLALAALTFGSAAFAAEEGDKTVPPAVEPAAAAEEEESGDPDWFPGAFSANVNWATDYVFRGISQTNEHAALQGGIDYSYEFTPAVKFNFGSWGSNVDFLDGDEGQLEIDLYGGLSGAVGSFSYGALAIYYEYPGAHAAEHYDYWEFGPNVAYDFGVMALSAQYLYSPDFFFETGDGHYLTAGITVPTPGLPEWSKIVFGANIGNQWIDENNHFGVRDYLHWDLGATVSAFGLDVDLRYTDTDISHGKCFGGGSAFGDWCDGRFVATVGKVF